MKKFVTELRELILRVFCGELRRKRNFSRGIPHCSIKFSRHQSLLFVFHSLFFARSLLRLNHLSISSYLCTDFCATGFSSHTLILLYHLLRDHPPLIFCLDKSCIMYTLGIWLMVLLGIVTLFAKLYVPY